MSGSQQPYMSTRQRVVVLDFDTPSAADEWSGALDDLQWRARQVIDAWDDETDDPRRMGIVVEQLRSALRALRQWVVDDD